jgi:3-hydroxyanthranilate 3,4-dioxygenase
MTQAFAQPFNLQDWIQENRHLLKPPVGNQVIYKGNQDFMVMVVGGPNSRRDFHINKGEELFYQLEGEIELKLMLEKEESKGELLPHSVFLKAGDMFLLPPNIPHSPRRGPNTIGLVIERYRNSDEKDGFEWHCENCGNLLHKVELPVSDIVAQLPVVMEQFFSSDILKTCKNCGTVMEKPQI